jgi:hypothetical protein
MMSRFYRDSKRRASSSIIETAMDNHVCHECQIIAEELAAAFDDAWESSDHKFKDAWLATLKMIGGTEEDAARAEEILGGYRDIPLQQLSFGVSEDSREPGSATIREALSRKYKHEALTGHKIQARL